MARPGALRLWALTLALGLVAPVPRRDAPAPPVAREPEPLCTSSSCLPLPDATGSSEPAMARVVEGSADSARVPAGHRIDPDGTIAIEPVPAPLGPMTAPPPASTALGPDAPVNDPAGDYSCALCGDRPPSQSETTVAIHGSHALAGWNETQGFCSGGAVQAYAWSVDGGRTWMDAGGMPALRDGGRYRGDPVHAVNRATGEFYMTGLYEGGIPGSGLGVIRGHFAGSAFVIDDNRQIAAGGPDVLDKQWIAVDPLTGNLYVTYTRFIAGRTARVEVVRSRDRGVTWDPPLVMNAPDVDGKVLGSRTAVGPDGEVYAVWYESGRPKSHVRLRRSDDHGATFGPERTVCDFHENAGSGAPGFRRGHGVAFPGIAVDASAGPHRGRVHVTWDEGVNASDAPAGGGVAVSGRENDGHFANATPFRIGDTLRGRFSTPQDLDFFRFTGSRGQTVVIRADSVTAGTATAMRLVCSADTTSIAAYRFLAFSQDSLPGIVFTLPADGVYYLRLQSATSLLPAYRLRTTLDTPSPGDRARDHRDPFLSWSDDGAVWSEPRRLADSEPGSDSVYPEVTVDGSGAVHVFWHDFRDDPACAAESHEYLVSSGDGGRTWGPNRRVSDARSHWSYHACGNANQGDYQGIDSDGRTVVLCWTDGRRGDPDVFAEALHFGAAASCPARDTTVAAGAELVLRWPIAPENGAHELEWSVETPPLWTASVQPSPLEGPLAPDALGAIEVRVTLPAACSGTPDTVRLIANDLAVPGRHDTCLTVVRCAAATDVVASRVARATFLAPAEPNPSRGVSRLRFALSRGGPARLEVFDVSGARVRRLAGGDHAAGEHEARWDGKDDQGRRVRPGLYFARLEAEGRILRRTIVRLE